MKWAYVAMILLLICALSSCVNVTTERSAESVSRTPEGGYARSSDVKVNAYDWNFLEAGLHVLLLPFKLMYHAVKIVL